MSRVTVLLPFYDVSSDFECAIESIVRQSFANWELFLISNNSNEAGIGIASKWERIDPRIHLLHEPRQGIAHALNRGLEHTTSEYVARMDADDVSMEDRLQLQLDYLDNHPHVDVVSAQTQFDSSLSKSDGYSLFVAWQNQIITPEQHALSRFVESPLAHPSVMFRKSLIDQYGPYHTGFLPEDYELWLRWMSHSVEFYKIPQALIVWRDHPSRLSRNHENYSREAFYQVKCRYLAQWILKNVSDKKHLVICGSSKIGRKGPDC